MGPHALRCSERTLAILRAGGLSPRLAVQGYLLLIDTVNGFTMDETGSRTAAARNSPGRAAEGRGHGPRLHRLAPGRAVPEHDRAGSEFAFSDPDERFEMLIDIFVEGLARRAAAS